MKKGVLYSIFKRVFKDNKFVSKISFFASSSNRVAELCLFPILTINLELITFQIHFI